ncbi:uncharacterized protein DFL_009739 [Arthrobotrys flagrans]|uniref:Uncharacterized protein n=1 Tax=Arthrobotrys flagrans TaxID=97331 RepID=A0A436ZSR6_ARTFL|nr:hypothetical protein DFL_009739 [Arthrobotrys flagrans]
MRPASINRVVPSLLLFLLAVNALPSGERQDDGAPQGDLNLSKIKITAGGFRKTVDKLLDDIKKAGDNEVPKSVQGRDIGTPGPATFHTFEVDRRSAFEVLEDHLPPHTYLESRAPDIELPEKWDLESNKIKRRDVNVNNIEKREPEPNIAEESPKKVKRNSGSQDMKAKLRARAEAERDKEEYESARRKWEERTAHNEKLKHHNMKRLFQHGSPFQEYHNTVPISAYAADDGSFGHALPGVRRSHVDEARKIQKRSRGTSPTKGDLARLQGLGYTPEEGDKFDPSDEIEKLRKRSEASGAAVTKWNRSPLSKRDISHHIACPGTGLMSSYGTILLSSFTYYTLIAVFRAACFGCDCKSATTGFYMGPREDGGCTARLVENCQMAGCRCLDTWSASDPLLVNKPHWDKGSKNRPASYSDVTYNPQTKAMYSDKYAAAAHVNEVTLGGFVKSKRHLQSPNLSRVGELFPPNKRDAVSPASEAKK